MDRQTDNNYYSSIILCVALRSKKYTLQQRNHSWQTRTSMVKTSHYVCGEFL